MQLHFAVVALALLSLTLAADSAKRRLDGRTNLNRTRLREREGRLDARLRRSWDLLPAAEKAAIKTRAERWANRRVEKINPAGDTLDEINSKGDLHVEGNLFEGDMVLTDDQLAAVLDDEDDDDSDEEKRSKRQAYKTALYPNNTWLGVEVLWGADWELEQADTPMRRALYKGVAFWDQNTCLKFISAPSGLPRINFMKGSGCYSNVGRLPGRVEQNISLGDGCDTVAIVAHELAHALGFLHEQSRHDRDNYVTINFENIRAGYEHNFRKETTATNDNYGLPYDLGSVMHYKASDFAKNPSVPVIVAKEAGYQNTMGHLMPTFYDVYMMNQYYKCFDQCPQPAPACVNGGVQNVNSCKKCVCPIGYAGEFCQLESTITTVVATTAVKTLTTPTRGNGRVEIMLDFHSGVVHLHAPAGKKIRFKITSIGDVCSTGCTYGGIEIHLKADKRQSGYRYCCNQDIGTVVTSETNYTRIHVYNRYIRSQATIEYSAV